MRRGARFAEEFRELKRCGLQSENKKHKMQKDVNPSTDGCVDTGVLGSIA